MATLEQTQTLPFQVSDDGTIRIARSRVSLESVIHHYKLGASAEQIVHKFPTLDLADAYSIISYYLNNQASVEEYIREQEEKGSRLQEKVESDPHHQRSTAALRARIQTRKSQR